MFEPLVLRDEAAVPSLVVVRLGARSLDDDLPCRARVTRRQANRVWVQLELGLVASSSSAAASERH